MYLGVNFGISEKLLIAFHELTSSFLIQTTLREGHDQQALDDFENIGKRPITRVPILFQCVNTYLS
jgi:hypothetical protein